MFVDKSLRHRMDSLAPLGRDVSPIISNLVERGLVLVGLHIFHFQGITQSTLIFDSMPQTLPQIKIFPSHM